MTRIIIRSVSLIDDGGNVSAYEWTMMDDGKVLGHGTEPTILEAAMKAGNRTYDTWGYSDSMGRLAVVGHEPVIVTSGSTKETLS